MSVAIHMITALFLLCAGCATRKPGGETGRLITTSYAEDNIVYHGVGISF